jgi:hypothetical protein
MAAASPARAIARADGASSAKALARVATEVSAEIAATRALKLSMLESELEFAHPTAANQTTAIASVALGLMNAPVPTNSTP